MESADFDKFIQSNTQESLEVPDGLDWDNMNIPLPPKKKNRKFFFFFLITGLLLVSYGSFLYLKTDRSPVAEENNNLNSNKNIKSNSSFTFENNDNSKISKNQNDLEYLSTSKNEIEKTQPDVFSATNTKNINQTKLTTKALTPILIDSLNNQSLPGDESSLDIIIKNSTPPNKREPLPLVAIQGVQSPLFSVDSERKKINSIFYFEPSDDSTDTVNNPPKGFSILLSFGRNAFNNNYGVGPQVDKLNIATSKELGNSYQLGFEYTLKKEFFTSLGVSLHSLHHTFSFREEPIVITDFGVNQRITRTKRVFHNNYFHFLELNLGAGKSFSWGKNWGTQIAIHLNPSLRWKTIGRTLNENNTIVDIEQFEVDQKFFLGVSGEARVFYQLKRNKIFTSIRYNQVLSNLNLINTSTLEFQPQMLNANIGISRSF